MSSGNRIITTAGGFTTVKIGYGNAVDTVTFTEA
jgi:hypothetical protein